ncbi:MAG: two-component regulator propeller domain-containing protein [Sphingobacteriales bacterium]
MAQAGFAFTRFSIDDGSGLRSNSIHTIYQDKKGYLWVGTMNGLQRFDGNKFVRFGISDNLNKPILDITDAGDGGLWLNINSLDELGLFYPATFMFKKIAVISNKEFPPRSGIKLWKGLKNETYLIAYHYGILKLNENDSIFTEKNLPFELPHNWGPTSVFVDSVEKRYWFSCDSGLAVYDLTSRKLWTKYYNPQKIPLLDNPVLNKANTQFYIDRKRRYWIFNWPGGAQLKYCIAHDGKTFLKDTAGLNNAYNGYYELLNFYETKNSLWIYGPNVIMYEDTLQHRFKNERTDYLDNFGIRFLYANYMYQDRDGSTWIGTDNGLYFFNQETNSVVNLFFSFSKGQHNFTDIMELPGGQYWISGWGSGIKTINKNFESFENNIYKNINKIAPDLRSFYYQAWALYQHSKTGKVWIGCQSGCLMVYDTLTKTTSFYRDSIFNNSTIRYITGDKENNLWFGTQGGRLIKYTNGIYTVVQNFGTIIYKVFYDKQGDIWVCTHGNGLYWINGKTGEIVYHFINLKNNKGLTTSSALDIEQLNDSLYYASSEVLEIINKNSKQIRHVTMEDGLPSNGVTRLRLDYSGNLWIMTQNGLCRYNYQKNKFSVFGKKDGIINSELTNMADYICKDGHVMFVGENNMLIFRPSSFETKGPPPDPVITDFRLLNRFLPVDSLNVLEEIKLDHTQNSFTLYFSSLSYLLRDRLYFNYMLEGVDRDWMQSDNNQVTYSLLPPGHYTFKVKCENNEGIPSKDIASLHIYIAPPFWRTGWFISTVLFFIALFIYTLHNLRVTRLLAVEKLRNRVARDLHDDMGSTLSTINILSSMAKAKIATDTVKTSEYINKISDNSQRMMEAMDDIVWTIKPANDTMQKIVARMREFATNVLEAKEIDIEFTVDETVQDITLDMEQRRDLFLLFKEAVNNVAKYSQCKNAIIRILVKDKKLLLIVADDGIGFDLKKADSGNGLGNMQKRADALHGRVEIISAPGNGTEVKLTVPLHN